MKEIIKIGMLISDYKLSNKDVWWEKALTQRPEIERDYDLVREEIGEGLTIGTTSLYRYYKLKEKK